MQLQPPSTVSRNATLLHPAHNSLSYLLAAVWIPHSRACRLTGAHSRLAPGLPAPLSLSADHAPALAPYPSTPPPLLLSSSTPC